MKKLLPIVVVGILVLSGLGAVALQENEDKMLFSAESIMISEPIITESNEYLTINLKESESLLLETGKPVLPVITKVYTFPLGTKISSVNVDFDVEKQVLSKKIQPSPRPVPLTNDIAVEKISTEPIIDEKIYSSSDLYPSESYQVNKGAGLNKGEHVLFLNVKITPQYSPADDVLFVPIGEIDIEVEYILPETPFYTGQETYDMLIITPEKFSAKLQPLVDHKNSIGVSTILDTTENIYATYNGRDDSEDIKLRIKDAVEESGIKYVLLAGGREEQTLDWYVPSRRTNNDDDWETGYESDLYYADIYKIEENETVFEDWDSNGNLIFAEDGNYPKDRMDFYPDVTVGRLPFRYESEIDIVVNKIIEYENNADDSWFKKAIMIAGDTFTPGRHDTRYGYYEGEMETAITVDLLEGIGFDVEKLWLSIPGAWTGPQDVINAISNGAGFIHMAGHSNPASWGSHPADDDGETPITIEGMKLRDMKEYSNENKLPIVVLGGCHSAQFNVTMSNIIKDIKEYGIGGYFFKPPHRFFYMEWVPRDLSSWLVLEEGGGAIASMGNCGLGYGYTDEGATEGLGGWIEPRFFDAYVNQSIDILGEVHDQAITDYINIIGNVNSDQIDRKTIEQWALIGDPSLQIGGV